MDQYLDIRARWFTSKFSLRFHIDILILLQSRGRIPTRPQPGVLCDKTVISAVKQERSLLYSFIHLSKIQCVLKILLLFSYIRLDVDIDSKNDSKTELICVSKNASFCSGKSEAGGVFASPSPGSRL